MTRRVALSIGSVLVVGLLLAGAYALWPIAPLPADVHVDSVLVLKSERRLVLLSQGTPVREYRIALGPHPIGRKTQEGDGKTPEGSYVLDGRREGSTFHLALHVSYPNEADRAQALARGVRPGAQIMVHGLRVGLIGRWHRLKDWTDGCIAVTNAEIEQIGRVVRDGTPIEIRP